MTPTLQVALAIIGAIVAYKGVAIAIAKLWGMLVHALVQQLATETARCARLEAIVDAQAKEIRGLQQSVSTYAEANQDCERRHELQAIEIAGLRARIEELERAQEKPLISQQ